MTDLFVVAFPFLEPNFKRLEQVLNEDPINAWLGSDDRSLATQLFTGAAGRKVFYLLREDKDRLSRLIDRSGYVVEGHLPYPYCRIKVRPKPGNKHKGTALKSAIERRRDLGCFMKGDFIFVPEDHRSEILQIVEGHDFECREESSYRQNS